MVTDGHGKYVSGKCNMTLSQNLFKITRVSVSEKVGSVGVLAGWGKGGLVLLANYGDSSNFDKTRKRLEIRFCRNTKYKEVD